MTVMIQASPKDAAGTLWNVKAEGDEPSVVWTDFGAFLTEIGGVETARAVRSNLVNALTGALAAPSPAPAPAPFADPLAAAVATVQNAFPGAQPAAPAMPGAALPSCQHGQKKIVRAKPGSGKNWVALGCPASQGDPTACKPGLDFDAARDLGL
jgi:hypothetical protein